MNEIKRQIQWPYWILLRHHESIYDVFSLLFGFVYVCASAACVCVQAYSRRRFCAFFRSRILTTYEKNIFRFHSAAHANIQRPTNIPNVLCSLAFRFGIPRLKYANSIFSVIIQISRRPATIHIFSLDQHILATEARAFVYPRMFARFNQSTVG